MIEIRESDDLRSGLDYLNKNLVITSPICEVILEFVENSRRMLSSRVFDDEDSLRHGNGHSRLVDDIAEFTSDHIEKNYDNVFILDNGFYYSDMDESEVFTPVEIYKPSLVYRSSHRTVIDKFFVIRALRLCKSFCPVFFIADDKEMAQPSITAVIISAFDQEGCIGWTAH